MTDLPSAPEGLITDGQPLGVQAFFTDFFGHVKQLENLNGRNQLLDEFNQQMKAKVPPPFSYFSLSSFLMLGAGLGCNDL